MGISKIKRFVADHKKGMIAVSAGVVGIVLMVLGMSKKSNDEHVSSTIRFVEDIDIPDELKVWNTIALWKEDGCLNAVIDTIPIDDLGELGRAYIESGFANPGDNAGVLIGV